MMTLEEIYMELMREKGEAGTDRASMMKCGETRGWERGYQAGIDKALSLFQKWYWENKDS